MDLRTSVENYYSKLFIICDFKMGKVTFLENYIPATEVEKFSEKILDEFSKKYNTLSCITETIKQPYGEKKISRIVDFQLNAYGEAMKEHLRKNLNRWTTYSTASTLSSLVRDFCILVLAYQTLKMIFHLRTRNIKQAQKHGINAIITGIVLIIMAKTLLHF